MDLFKHGDLSVIKIKLNGLELQCTSSMALSPTKSLLYIGGGMNFKWKKFYPVKRQNAFFKDVKSLIFVLDLQTVTILGKIL